MNKEYAADLFIFFLISDLLHNYQLKHENSN